MRIRTRRPPRSPRPHLPQPTVPLPTTLTTPAHAGTASHGALADVDEAALVPLLVAFYDTIGREPMLAPYFAPLDMRAHIPRIADFWSTLLFHSGRYEGNAFRPHADMPGLTGEHFARWVATLETTVDARHAGPMAEQLKLLAHRIAYSMQLRLHIPPFVGYR